MTPSHQDAVAVITGASRGIGAGIARGLHRAGLRLGLCARSDPDPGQLPDDPERILYTKLDVTDADALARFGDAVSERFGAPALWINNAGILEPIGMLRDADPAAFNRHLAVNVGGVYHGSRVFIRLCHTHDRPGTLINIGSGASHSPYEGWGAYCTGKAAVDMLTRVIAEEERPHKIRAFSLAPGVIETGMQELIRGQTEQDFPLVEKFREMHAEGALLDPESPTPAILRLAFRRPAPDVVVLDVRKSEYLQGL